MPKRLKSTPEVEHGAQYMGIGHTSPDSFVWIWMLRKFSVWDITKGMHHEVIGRDFTKYWRGRFETYTGTISAVPPDGSTAKIVPMWLRDRLGNAFPGAKVIKSFNPGRRSMR
jgi:hypothetical protein